jgi:glutathione S-transferase
MDWQLTTLGPAERNLFWGLVRTPADKRDMAAIAQAIEDTTKGWRMIEARLSQHAFIAGDELTLCDIPWGVHAHRWFNMDYLGLERPDLPAVKAWYDRLCPRAPYRLHIADHKVV